MALEVYALAILFGTLVSATIYFVFVWPRREPPDE